jgi:uncharacterized C2H2 Zn-finger protein
MVEYKCNACDKIYVNKYDFNRHMKRKNPCKLRLSDNINIDLLSSQVHTISTVQISNNNEHKCPNCLKTFSRKDALTRHLNEICKLKPTNGSEINKEHIFMQLLSQMSKQMCTLEKKLNEIQNVGTNIDKQQNVDKQQINIDKQIVNNNNNVKLIAFGKEDMSYITDNVCKQILSKGFNSVPKLIEQVHFNKDKPEYHNVYIPNFKNNFAMVFDGDDWGLRDRDTIIDQLNDEKTEFICGKFHELMEAGELSESTIKKLKRFLNEKDEDPADTNLKNDIKLILYNKRNMVVNTKKKVTGMLK